MPPVPAGSNILFRSGVQRHLGSDRVRTDGALLPCPRRRPRTPPTSYNWYSTLFLKLRQLASYLIERQTGTGHNVRDASAKVPEFDNQINVCWADGRKFFDDDGPGGWQRLTVSHRSTEGRQRRDVPLPFPGVALPARRDDVALRVATALSEREHVVNRRLARVFGRSVEQERRATVRTGLPVQLEQRGPVVGRQVTDVAATHDDVPAALPHDVGR